MQNSLPIPEIRYMKTHEQHDIADMIITHPSELLSIA
jgi:hypothetical protein